MANITFDYNLEIDGVETVLSVEATYTPAERGHRDGLGAPEEPDTEATMDIDCVTGPEGQEFTECDLPAEWQHIINKAWETLEQEQEEEPDWWLL